MPAKFRNEGIVKNASEPMLVQRRCLSVIKFGFDLPIHTFGRG